MLASRKSSKYWKEQKLNLEKGNIIYHLYSTDNRDSGRTRSWRCEHLENSCDKDAHCSSNF